MSLVNFVYLRARGFTMSSLTQTKSIVSRDHKRREEGEGYICLLVLTCVFVSIYVSNIYEKITETVLNS
jgi:hypothetical protein